MKSQSTLYLGHMKIYFVGIGNGLGFCTCSAFLMVSFMYRYISHYTTDVTNYFFQSKLNEKNVHTSLFILLFMIHVHVKGKVSIMHYFVSLFKRASSFK